MVEQAATSCSIGHTILLSLITGELGSLGFFANMLLISGIIYLYKSRKVQQNFEAAKKIAADMIRNAPASQ